MDSPSCSSMSPTDLLIAINLDPERFLKYIKDLESQNTALVGQLQSIKESLHSITQIALSEMLTAVGRSVGKVTTVFEELQEDLNVNALKNRAVRMRPVVQCSTESDSRGARVTGNVSDVEWASKLVFSASSAGAIQDNLQEMASTSNDESLSTTAADSQGHSLAHGVQRATNVINETQATNNQLPMTQVESEVQGMLKDKVNNVEGQPDATNIMFQLEALSNELKEPVNSNNFQEETSETKDYSLEEVIQPDIQDMAEVCNAEQCSDMTSIHVQKESVQPNVQYMANDSSAEDSWGMIAASRSEVIQPEARKTAKTSNSEEILDTTEASFPARTVQPICENTANNNGFKEDLAVTATSCPIKTIVRVEKRGFSDFLEPKVFLDFNSVDKEAMTINSQEVTSRAKKRKALDESPIYDFSQPQFQTLRDHDSETPPATPK